MSRYLDPKADVVFKKIFGDHPHLLISFLNAVLPLAVDSAIVGLTYLSPEHIPPIPAFKRTIADVKCKDAKGRVFIVEMQINWTDSFKQRLLFGTSQAIVKQLEKGEAYRLLQPVYGLGIVADLFDKASETWYHHYQLVKKEGLTHEVIEHLQLIFIELPKFPIHSPEEKRLRVLWLRFLREVDEKTTSVSPELLAVPEIAEAVGLAEEAAYTPGELNAYEAYWDSVRTEKTLGLDKFEEGLVQGEALGIEKGMKQGIEEGLAQGEALGIEKGVKEGLAQGEALGIEKGVKEGLAQGEALGIEKGVKEGIEKIARTMLKANTPLEDIRAFTGLSQEVLAQFKADLSDNN